MVTLYHHDKCALEYVRNTAGNATLAIFKDDHDPIGDHLWTRLSGAGLVVVNEQGKVVLTDDGVKALT